MSTVWLIIVFLLGAIVGSFLNVVIYRLHTGKSLKGRSHCLSCGSALGWYELIPVCSYIALQAHCRHCASFIPLRYLIVEVLTGLLFILAVFISHGDIVLFSLHTILFSLVLVIVIYDIRHTIIPNELVLALLALALVFVGYRYYQQHDFTIIWGSVLTGIGVASFFWLLWFVSKGKWIGLGDAKLAFPLAMIAGPLLAFSVVVFSFWIGAVISVSLLLSARVLKRWKTSVSFSSAPLTIKSEVPFAPFLVLGFLLAYAFHVDIFTFTLFFL